jgi:hypothetical protein
MLLVAPMLSVRADSNVGPDPKSCDLNNSGSVNIDDIILASDVFLMTNSSPLWNVTYETFPQYGNWNFTPSMADVGGYGVVNILDLIIIAMHFDS